MEQIIGLLVALAIWLLPALISGKKKAREQQAPTRQQAPQGPSPLETMKRILQEMSDDDEVLFDEKEECDDAVPAYEFEEEGQPVPAPQEARPIFTFQEEGQPATSMEFSSENMSNEESRNQDIEVRLEETADSGSALDESFDLRKAFIYQTILQNKYVTNCDC